MLVRVDDRSPSPSDKRQASTIMSFHLLFLTLLLSAKLHGHAFSPLHSSPRVSLAVSRNGIVREAIVSRGDGTRSPHNDLPDALDTQPSHCSRRQAFHRVLLPSLVGLGSSLYLGPSVARADVSDGNQLPQGAAQFARVVRLSSDLKGVRARAAEHEGEIDDREWDNIGKFLRTAYTIADQDMKAVAAGIVNPDNKKRALSDADQLKTYAQAGDVPTSKKDAAKLVPVLDKMSGLVSDFLDSLSDVPDEI
jgi:hypothetical protein